ncbi:hypothetical protein, partial [Enterobacter cloacae complex sp. 2DZ2F20B]|uniref:hypothetical protein n=1 Tax=Enterobacter cloacae complex sp. 2DZ2F20B TaxID=2511993 RepID=UPI001CA52B19
WYKQSTVYHLVNKRWTSIKWASTTQRYSENWNFYLYFYLSMYKDGVRRMTTWLAVGINISISLIYAAMDDTDLWLGSSESQNSGDCTNNASLEDLHILMKCYQNC